MDHPSLTLPTTHLQPGMTLADDVTARNGRFLLAKGTVLAREHLRVLWTWGVEAVLVLGGGSHDAEGCLAPHCDVGLRAELLRVGWNGGGAWGEFAERNNLAALARDLSPEPESPQPVEMELERLRREHAFLRRALEQAASLCDLHADIGGRDDQRGILGKARRGIDALILFPASAFYLMNESLADLSPIDIHPRPESSRVQELFEVSLFQGLVARTIWEQGPLLVTHPCGDRYLLHLMSTAARVRGLFLGLLDPRDVRLPDAVVALLGNVLQNAASALESAELYAIFHRQNRELQSQVEKRTAQLKETVDRLEVEVGERRQVQRELARSLDNLALILNNVHDAIIIYRPEGEVLEVNEKVLRMFSITREQALAMSIPGDVTCPRRLEDGYFGEWSEVLSKERTIFEWTVRRMDGSIFPVEVFLRKITWNGETAVLGTMRDITRRKETEHQLEFLALHDPLTELPNRKLFLDRLSQAMAAALRKQTSVAVLYLDLDGFKPVNDRHGHDAGDGVLKVVSARMRDALRKSDTVARIGGDEFGLVIADLLNPQDYQAVMAKIHDVVRRPMLVNGHKITLDCSIGTALFPDEGQDVDALIKLADERMYVEKGGKGERASPGVGASVSESVSVGADERVPPAT